MKFTIYLLQIWLRTLNTPLLMARIVMLPMAADNTVSYVNRHTLQPGVESSHHLHNWRKSVSTTPLFLFMNYYLFLWASNMVFRHNRITWWEGLCRELMPQPSSDTPIQGGQAFLPSMGSSRLSVGGQLVQPFYKCWLHCITGWLKKWENHPVIGSK